MGTREETSITIPEDQDEEDDQTEAEPGNTGQGARGRRPPGGAGSSSSSSTGPAETNQTHVNETTPLLPPDSTDGGRAPATDNQRQGDFENRMVTTVTEAVKRGSLDDLREMLANRSATEVHQEVRCSLLLHEAIDKGTPKVLEMLLDKLNEQESDAREDIQSRTWNRFTEELMYVRDNEENTALHKAAIKNKPKMLKLLIENGGKVDTRNGREQTPLHIAAWKGSAGCTRILIKNISDDQLLKTYLDSRDNNNATALMRAAKYSHLKVCNKLIPSNANLQDDEGDTALHHAAKSGCTSVVELLLTKCKAHSSIRNKKHELAVQKAVSGGKDNAHCFIVLLENTKLEDTTSSHANLLKEATQSHSIKCLTEMLERGEFRELIDHKFTEEYNTVLHYSLINANFKIARLLLEKNANKNIRNKRHEFPAHLLAKIRVSECHGDDDVQYVHKNIMTNMLEKCEIKTIEGKNLIELAAASGNEEMIRHLLRYQCSRVAGVLEASRLGKESSLRRLLKALPLNQAAEIKQNTPHPLHLAAENGHLGCCAILLETFKDPDLLLIKDENMNHPVDLAYQGKKFEVFQFLLQKMEHKQDLKDFASRLHHYCEESVNGNISDRMVCIETIVDSEWCRVAFDSEYCRSDAAGRVMGTGGEPPKQAKPLCKSLAKLVRKYPRLACKILDQYIISTPAVEQDKIEDEVNADQQHPEQDQIEDEVNADQQHTEQDQIEDEVNADQQYLEGHVQHDYAPFEPKATINVNNAQNQTTSTRETISWENHPLLAALDTKNTEVLTHTLSKSWLNYKYNAYAKWLLLFYVILDALTAIFTSGMFGLLRNTYQLETFYNGATREEICDVYATITPLDSIDQTNRSMVQEIQTKSSSDPTCSQFNVSTTTGMDMEYGTYPPPGTNSWNRAVCAITQLQQNTGWVAGLYATVFVLFLVNVCFVCRLFFTMRRNILKYVKGFELVRCVLIVSLFIIVLPLSTCDLFLGLRQEYVWICGLFSVLLAWINLIITLSRVPTLTGYMEISGKFFYTYVKGILFILLIILAFALTFYFLLQTEGRAFSTIPYSFLKTMVWMFGEFQYNETFIDNGLPLKYQILSNFLFALFIAVVVGFIFNIIVASPKALLEDIRKNSEFQKAKASLMLIYIADLGFPFLRRPFDRNPVLVRSEMTYHTSSSSSSSASGPKDISAHDQSLRHLEILEQLQQMRDEISQLAQLKDQISQLSQLKDQISQLAQWKDDISQLAQMKDEIKEMTQIVRDLQ